MRGLPRRVTLLALGLALPSPALADGAELTVVVTGIRGEAGTANLALFAGPDGFPTNADKALEKAIVPIRDGRAEARFTGLPPGVYAVSFLHDANGDGRLGTNLLGIPTEGIGCSNNPKIRFGPYTFEEGRFTVQEAPLTVTLTAWYPP